MSEAPAIWSRTVRLFGDEQKAARGLSAPLWELGEWTPLETLRDDSSR